MDSIHTLMVSSTGGDDMDFKVYLHEVLRNLAELRNLAGNESVGDWKLASEDASYFLTNLDYGSLDVMDPSGVLSADVRRAIGAVTSLMLDPSMMGEYQESINNIYNFMDELDTEFY